MSINTSVTRSTYNHIDDCASSNQLIQGISGLLGFPYTLIADGVVLFSHYQPMINRIREIFGCGPLDSTMLGAIAGASGNELLFDILFDKVLGQIPVLGIYFNLICAQALTWRLGMIIAVLSSRGEKIELNNVQKLAILVRKLTPQSDVFRFAKPDYYTFENIILSVYDLSEDDFSSKLDELIAG